MKKNNATINWGSSFIGKYVLRLLSKNRVMAFFKKNQIEIIFVILVAFLIHFMIRDMGNLYYAHDEWKALGATYVYGLIGDIKLLSSLEIFSGKGRILFLLLKNATLYLAPFQTYPFVIIAYVFHFFNTILLYAIVKKLSKSTFLAFMAGIFFVTGSAGSQVFSWLAALYENLFSTFFSLLCIWLYLNIPKKHTAIQSVKLLLSWICVIAAYYFKETGIVIVVLLLWLYWITHEKGKFGIVQVMKRHLPLIVVFLGIGISRMITHYFIRGNPYFVQQTHASLPRILFHLVYYPFTTFAHLFIPYELMVRASSIFFHLNYYAVGKIFSETATYVLQYYVIADYLSFIVTIAIFIFIYIVLKPVKKYRILLSLSLLYYILQLLPLIFYDLAKGSAYFESRYYYIFLPSGAIIFALVVDSVRDFLAKLLRSSLFAGVIVLIFASGFFYKQALVMKRNVLGASVYAQRTKHAMEQFTHVRSSLPDKPIIFLSGNTEYFTYPRHYIPTQPNPGYVLMVWYYKTGKIPGELILEQYNFSAGEGYRELGNKAYGYFNDKRDLLTLFEQKPSLSVDQVVGFYYDGATDKLSDSTMEVREYLQKELAEKNNWVNPIHH
jgi:hypothetical protein